MIPAYNTGRYLEQTLKSVLEQDPGPDKMQIEVIDDCSTEGGLEGTVRSMGRGRIAYYRKKKNEGAIKNFNTCIERSQGELVHILHGDDCVLPGFYQEMQSVAAKNPGTNAFICRSFTINEDNDIESLSSNIKGLSTPSKIIPKELIYSNEIKTPGVVIRKTFYEQHGGFLESLPHVADWEMWTRCIALGEGVFLNKPLTCYRSFDGNDTGRLVRTGDNIRDCMKMSSFLSQRVPGFDAKKYTMYLAMGAKSQMEKFEKIGDGESAEKNRALWKELSAKKTCMEKLTLTVNAVTAIWGAR